MTWSRPPLVPLTSPLLHALEGDSIAGLKRPCPGCRRHVLLPGEDCPTCSENPFLADPDSPSCEDCGGEADMFTQSEWLCDHCDDRRAA